MNKDGKNQMKEKELDLVAQDDTPDRAERRAQKAAEKKAEEKAAKAEKAWKKEKGKLRKTLTSSKFKHSGLATVFSCVFVAVVILVNVLFGMLVDRIPALSFDLTADQVNSLSEDAKKVADSVKEDVSIYIIGSEDDVMGDVLYSSYGMKYSQVGYLSQKFAAENSHISVQFIDPDSNPGFLSKYSEDNLDTGMVLIESSRRHRVLTVTDLFSIEQDSTYGNYTYYSMVDSALTNAINQVTLETVPIAAFETGHQEMLSSESNNISSVYTLLEENGFEVVEFNSLTEDVPENAQLLVLAAPNTDYTQDELEKFDAYLEDKTVSLSRAIFITCHPTQTELVNLNTFCQEWGIIVDYGSMLQETDESHRISSSDNYVLSNYLQGGDDDPITFSTTNSYDLLLTPASCNIRSAYDSSNGIVSYPLLGTYDTASKMYIDEESNEWVSDGTTQQYYTMVMGQKWIQDADKNNLKRSVVVSGSTSMLVSTFLASSTYSNNTYINDLFLYLTDYTVGDNKVTTAKVETNVMDITATTAMSTFLGFWVFTIGLPVALLIVGVVIWLKRRHL